MKLQLTTQQAKLLRLIVASEISHREYQDCQNTDTRNSTRIIELKEIYALLGGHL